MQRPLIGLNCDIESDGAHGAKRIQLGADYADGVAAAGGLPLIVPATLSPAMLAEIAGRCDGFVFIGGADYPSEWYDETPHPRNQPINPVRAAADRVLLTAAWERGMPLLAICGGLQLLNIVRGGKLTQHMPQAEAHTTGTHAVTMRGGRILRGLFGEGRIMVNTSHHQAIRPGAIGDGLLVVAQADDGTIEALEGTDPRRLILGVQWHPERIDDPLHRQKVFGTLIMAAQGRCS